MIVSTPASSTAAQPAAAPAPSAAPAVRRRTPARPASRVAAEAAKSGQVTPAAQPAKAAKLAKATKPPKPAKAPKVTKEAKEAKAGKPVKAPKTAPAEAGKGDKRRMPLVRDSFTMPADDFALVAALKARALSAQRVAKKSELLRAGLQALAAMDTPALLAALQRLAPVKQGRPKG